MRPEYWISVGQCCDGDFNVDHLRVDRHEYECEHEQRREQACGGQLGEQSREDHHRHFKTALREHFVRLKVIYYECARCSP